MSEFVKCSMCGKKEVYNARNDWDSAYYCDECEQLIYKEMKEDE